MVKLSEAEAALKSCYLGAVEELYTNKEQEDKHKAYTNEESYFRTGKTRRAKTRNTAAIIIKPKLPRRNDKCPCGSSKKYKHCCLKDYET